MNLTDEQWRLIEPILPPPSPSGRGRPPLDRRAVLDGILWKFRTGNPWYDMLPDYPSYQTCYRCHRKCARDGVIKKIYAARERGAICQKWHDNAKESRQSRRCRSPLRGCFAKPTRWYAKQSLALLSG